MGMKPQLRPGKAKESIKIVSRTRGNVNFVKKLAKELQVPLGAVYDTLVNSVKNDPKDFKDKVRQTWHDRYAR